MGQPPTESQTDPQLIDRMNAGGADAAAAFGELYQRHKDWAINVARRMTASEAATLDVVQDSFVSFMKQFPGFELTAALRTYLYAVIRNRARDHRRKNAKLTLVGDFISEGLSQSEAAVDPARTEQLNALRNAITELPENQREVLILRLVEGFSVIEVGRALEIPEGTVKSRLHLAIKALREHEATRKYF